MRALLKISKTIGLSSARERERKVRGRIHVRTYIAGISSQHCDGGKNFLPGLKISPGCKMGVFWCFYVSERVIVKQKEQYYSD